MKIKELPKVLVQLVSTNLCWIDVFALRLTSKSINKLIVQLKFSKCLYQMLIRRLGSEMIAELLWQEMVQHDIKISGSVILQLLYGLEWEFSDLDLYKTFDHSKTPTKEDASYLHLLNQSNVKYYQTELASNYEEMNLVSRKYRFAWCTDDDTSIEKFPLENISQNGHDEESKNRQLLPGHINLKIPLQLEVNHISVNSRKFASERQFIRNVFDLEICMNLYSPRTNSLEIANLDALFNRTSRSFFKLENYNLGPRGFHESDYTKEMVVEKFLNRCRKYTARGFDIMN